MNDDVRRPRNSNQTSEDKNKKPLPTTAKATQQAVALEAPHRYNTEEGFAAAKAARKIKHNRLPGVFILRHATKRQQLVGGVIIGVLLLSGGGGVYAMRKKYEFQLQAAASTTQVTAQQTTQPATEASLLTGAQIAPDLNKRPVTGVMIENSPEARPQSGLDKAGVVYEAIAEGGITRFLALYQEGQPESVGPVRSVRPYYIDFLLPYDASIVHAGGSADGLTKIKKFSVKDIDHSANENTFKRTDDRKAPHNLYTSMSQLDTASKTKGYTSSNVTGLARSDEKATQSTFAKSIDLAVSTAQYNVHYDYDVASNSYKRALAGKPHTDLKSGQQLAPRVVVALSMNFSQRGIYSVYQTTGSGVAHIFQNGAVQQGMWNKASERDQFTFTDANGAPILLNSGQTWISIVKAPSAVTFTP